jgi:hypothetical protein
MNVKRLNKKKTNTYNKKRKVERINLEFRKINFLYYINIDDLFSGSVKGMNLVVDEVKYLIFKNIIVFNNAKYKYLSSN